VVPFSPTGSVHILNSALVILINFITKSKTVHWIIWPPIFFRPNVQIAKDNNKRFKEIGLTRAVPSEDDIKSVGGGESLSPSEIEITDQMFLITKATAEEYLKLLAAPPQPEPEEKPGEKPPMPDERKEPPKPPVHETKRIAWTGEIPWQKWGVFYNKVLTRYATGKGLKMTLTLTATVEASEGAGISSQQIEETKVTLRELGLDDDVEKA